MDDAQLISLIDILGKILAYSTSLILTPGVRLNIENHSQKVQNDS